MKILILSCSTGEGHNSAARAVKEELVRRGIACELLDPVSLAGKKAQHTVSSLYENTIRTVPAVFGAVYGLGNLYSHTGVRSPVYLACASLAEPLWQYIQEGGFDAAVATHLYGMEALDAIRYKLNQHIPSYGVLTDYTVIPFFAEPRLDGYFIPHGSLRSEMSRVPAEKTVVTGIPVSLRFAERLPQEAARKRLQIPADRPMLLVMSGGVGGGNVMGLCRELLQKTDADLYVICGRNERLFRQLGLTFPAKRVHPVSFTKEVASYMNAADVLLSKPGGLSSTEAAVAGVPLVHINAIPGCETKNAVFFAENGMSVNAKSIPEAAEAARELLACPWKRDAMRRAQYAVINPYAARDISEVIVR